MPCAILLDLYGTLVAADWALLGPSRDALAREVGVPVDAARAAWAATHERRMRGEYGSLESDIAAVFAVATRGESKVDARTLRRLAARERESWRRGVRLFPDVVPALERLGNAGVRLAVVTNASAEAASVIPELGLDRMTDACVVSCQSGLLKPKLLETALRRLGVPASETVLIDDEPAQVEAAVALRMRALLIDRTWRHDRIGGADGQAAAPVIADLTEVPGVILGVEPLPRR